VIGWRHSGSWMSGSVRDPNETAESSGSVAKPLASWGVRLALAPFLLVGAYALATRPAPFLLIPEQDAYTDEYGMLMICPAHKHGKIDQALATLKQKVADHPTHRMSSIRVCRADHLNTLDTFAPLVDQVFINSLYWTSSDGPERDDIVWPGLNHPLVNNVREVRRHAAGRRLVACVNVHGEKGYFRKRRATFEEIEWMVCAVIGAGYKGIVWRYERILPPFADRLSTLEGNLKKHVDELGRATLTTDPRTAAARIPVATLRTPHGVFVVLLNPEYMQFTDAGTVRLPLDPSVCRGNVEVTLPEGTSLKTAQRLDGTAIPVPVPISAAAHADADRARTVRLPFRFAGDGEILVLSLSGETGSD